MVKNVHMIDCEARACIINGAVFEEVLVDGVRPANPKGEQIVAPGALVEVRLPGGGGYGLAGHRDPELVTRDALEGYIPA